MDNLVIKRHAIRLYKKLRLNRIVSLYNNLSFLYRKPYLKLIDVIPVSGHGVFIRGWALDPGRRILKICYRDSDGADIDLTDDLLWMADDKLSSRFGMYKFKLRPRFVALIKLPSEAQSIPVGAKLDFELKSGGNRRLDISVTHRRTTVMAEVEQLLRTAPHRSAEKREWYDKVYGPAVQAIWRTRATTSAAADVVDYNSELAPAAPRATLVVPIYGRYDFIEFQLAEFANDVTMQHYQVLYVIDDPRLAAEVRASVDVLARIYKIAFTVVYLAENLGFAGANNVAVEHARSDLLLLMNSDVMPASTGWLDKLIDSTGTSTHHSITGVRLLYEDNSIQHNGMRLTQSPFVNQLWTNMHPGKGLPTNLVASNDSLIDVEAITGACMLISKANYLALGGFDENYILGDYEDSDLCLKARQQGLKIQLNDSVALYHLERLSQSMVTGHSWKQEVTYYNCWYHTSKWDQEIRCMKAQGGGENE